MCSDTTLKPIVSIIMPVHNSNGYVRQALDSLLAQSLREIEIITVLDIPTDGSDDIVKEYAKHDSRIKVIKNKENMHIGMSRNIGIEHASGDYIGFFDHDDFCEPDMYLKLLSTAQSDNADIVLSIPTEVDEKGNILFRREANEPVNRDNVYKAMVTHYSHPVFPFVHTNLYRRELLQKNVLRFVDTKENVPEDVTFNLECSFFSHLIVMVNESLYYHRTWENNEALKPEYNNIIKRLHGFDYVVSFLREHDPSAVETFCKTIDDYIVWFLKQSLQACKKPWKAFSFAKSIISRDYIPIVFYNYRNKKTDYPHPLLRMTIIRIIYWMSLAYNKKIS